MHNAKSRALTKLHNAPFLNFFVKAFRFSSDQIKKANHVIGFLKEELFEKEAKMGLIVATQEPN